MPNSSVEQLIAKIKSRGDELSARETINISINADDLVRIKALSELYKLPLEELSVSNVRYPAADRVEDTLHCGSKRYPC